jgi:hypothetical protein
MNKICKSIVVPEPDSLFKISPIPLTYGINVSHIDPLYLVCRPVTRQYIISTSLLKLLRRHTLHFVFVNCKILSIITLREHDLAYVKFVFV